MVNVVSFLWFERKRYQKIWIWKILSFIHVNCRSTMQNSKLRHIGTHNGCWNDCILIRINITKSTIFDFMRNDALQNNLVKLLKYLAESFDNLEFQKTQESCNCSEHQIVTSCIAMFQCGSFTLSLRGNDMKTSKKWKILNFIHVHYRTTMQNSKLWLQVDKLMVLIDCILLEIKETKLATFDFKKNDALQN